MANKHAKKATVNFCGGVQCATHHKLGSWQVPSSLAREFEAEILVIDDQSEDKNVRGE